MSDEDNRDFVEEKQYKFQLQWEKKAPLTFLKRWSSFFCSKFCVLCFSARQLLSLPYLQECLGDFIEEKQNELQLRQEKESPAKATPVKLHRRYDKIFTVRSFDVMNHGL